MEQMPNENGTAMEPGAQPGKLWPIEGRDRRMLPVSLALAFLAVCVLLELMSSWKLPGLGVTALTAGWYGAIFLCRGTAGMERRENRWLMAAVILISLTFTIFSNSWFRRWNLWALVLLAAVHTWELCGGTALPWYRAGMLAERLGLLVGGCFARLGALRCGCGAAARQGKGRWLPVLAGAGLALPAVWLVTSVLMDADALFALVAGEAVGWVNRRFGQALLRLLLAVFLVPFLYSLLYFTAHPPKQERTERTRRLLDNLPAVILLGALDGVYILFLTVQFTALFGGPEYLQRAGLSFAEYARSGFFQLVGLAGANVALILLAIWMCRDSKGLRWFSTVLVGLTAVLLVSALWRMTLYVSAYGLSFKRLLTYWGMAMLAILLTLTVRKIWRRNFTFFRAAAPIALAGWLLLNYCNADGVAAGYNAGRVQAGQLPRSAVDDLLTAGGGYDGLHALRDVADEVLIQWKEDSAAEDCGSWATWSLSAWLNTEK